MHCKPVTALPTDEKWRDGESLLRVPIERRRDELERMLPNPKDPLRVFRPAAAGQAPTGEVLQAVRKLGLEGVIGERIGSIYEPGERSGAWIKLRANMEQEFVIGGYIPVARGFDALLVGLYEIQTAYLRCEGEERLRLANSR